MAVSRERETSKEKSVERLISPLGAFHRNRNHVYMGPTNE